MPVSSPASLPIAPSVLISHPADAPSSVTCPLRRSTPCPLTLQWLPGGASIVDAHVAQPWLHRSPYDPVTCQNDHGHAVTPPCPWDPSPLSPGSRQLGHLLWPLPGAPDSRRDSCLSPSPFSRTPVGLEYL